MATTIWPSIAAAVQNSPHTARAPMQWDPASLLLARFAFGDQPASRAELATYGYDGWWARQLAMPTGYVAQPAIAAHGSLLGLSPKDVRAWLAANGNEYGWELMDQLTEVTLGLQTWSPAQLYETVVDFFANHLNVANHSDGVWTTRHTMDRDVVRQHAFGSFTDMLLASARNPAMLQYLSLARSTKAAVNENYGRELLELHTVGIGNYTETDVQSAAKLLTGRTTDADYNYLYNPNKHWVGPITVLGFSHPNSTAAGGEAAGDAFLTYLASHPKTASRLAWKLCVRYVCDTPTPSLVAEVAKAYLDNGTRILPMLSVIVRSTEFWTSRGAKVRRPAENLLATIRILGYGPGALAQTLPGLHWMSSAVGQVPLDWSPPNGYPDVATAWRSSGTLLNLWQYHRGFAQSWWDGFDPLDLTTLYGGSTPATSGAAIATLCVRLTGSLLPAAHLQALQTFLAEPASTPLAKSSLRWYLAHLVPLILDSPAFALR
ncbi:MAG: DUF1800 domain-containing protein [Jatrophihabitantaceae bacterium]